MAMPTRQAGIIGACAVPLKGYLQTKPDKMQSVLYSRGKS